MCKIQLNSLLPASLLPHPLVTFFGVHILINRIRIGLAIGLSLSKVAIQYLISVQ